MLADLRAAILSGDRTQARRLASTLVEEDAQELLIDLDEVDLTRLFDVLGDEELADLVSQLEDEDAADVIERLSTDQAADLLEEIDPDDASDILGEVDPDRHEEILVAMEPAEAAELRELMAYPPDTAGGLMTPAFVSMAPTLRADQAITALRRVAETAETVNYVYVVDGDDHLLGVLSLHRLVLARPDAPVSDLMFADPIRVPVDADQEEAANLLTERNLLALPVVDAAGRIVGIITQDDVADVLEEEATEDIERLGGSQPLETPYRLASIGLLFRRRIVWLLALFVAEAYTGTVMRAFQDELDTVVALAFFIPLLIGTGGNIGSQITTTLIRAMAVGEVRLRDVRWVLGKEVVVGLMIGAVMASAALGRSELLGVGTDVGLVVALTIAAICVWSSIVAAMLPLVLSKLRVDPAVVSAPFITTLVDGTGLIIYFTIARVILDL